MAEGMLGEVRLFAGSFVPQNWAPCNGGSIQITQNMPLYSILGTAFGGDGTHTFNLPNLQALGPREQGQTRETGDVSSAPVQYIICTAGSFPSRG